MLQDFRREFDSSSLDYNNRHEIEQRLELIKNKAQELGNTDEMREAQRELEVFCLNKSIKKGLIAMSSGTGTDKDGNQVSICWPDLNSFSDTDWEMIESRYIETNNSYGKYEYGMMLFLAKKKIDNKFVLQLLQNIQPLLDNYYAKLWDDDKNKTYYTNLFLDLLQDLFSLALIRKKSNADIHNYFEAIKKFIYTTIVDIDPNVKASIIISIWLTDIVCDNYQEFSSFADIDLILSKNKEILEAQKKINESDVKDVAEVAIKLALKAKKENTYWHRMIAESYVSMAKKRGGIVSPEFYMEAIKHYKIIKDDQKVKEVHFLFCATKKKMDFGKISHKLDSKDAKSIFDRIKIQVESLTTEKILFALAQGIEFPRFSVFLKKESATPDLSFFKMIKMQVFDKHGNKNYSTNPAENAESNHYLLYGLEFQMPSQINFDFFVESVKSGKVNYIEIEKWFEKSWIGKEYIRVYNGYSRLVIPYELIKPGIKAMVNEFEKFLSPDYNSDVQGVIPDFICSIDSLAPKVEYLFRILFEEQLGLSTTRIKEDGTWEEKMLTELLNDLRKFAKTNLDEPIQCQLLDDISFIDFVMNHRAGMNIRNQVAHSHFDKEEYSADKAVLVLCVLFRMSLWPLNSFVKSPSSRAENPS